MGVGLNTRLAHDTRLPPRPYLCHNIGKDGEDHLAIKTGK